MESPQTIAIVTRSDRMRTLLGAVDTVARTDASVLLVGETGVGKELFADYIHRLSPRWDRPFVKIALAAMPHELLESELFGHERGAFTSAQAEKKGLFELAHTGTIFLDDVDDVPPAVQTKLLRVLESREVMRVGGTASIAADVRLISASKVDLKDLVDRHLFRADLYYRINVLPVQIPPLRERPEDVVPLFEHFLRRFAPQKPLSLSAEAVKSLTAYRWPGNVRELRNVAQRLVLFAEGEIGKQDLPPEVHDGHALAELVRACTRCMLDESLSYDAVIDCLETNLLRQALVVANGNRSLAAQALGLRPSTLRDKLRKHGLNGGTD